MLDDEKLKKLEEKFEEEGEEKVRADLALGIYGNLNDPTYPKAMFAKVWLEKKETQRQETSRKEEIMIAKEANDIARSAKDASWWALVISAISIIIAVLVAIFK